MPLGQIDLAYGSVRQSESDGFARHERHLPDERKIASDEPAKLREYPQDGLDQHDAKLDRLTMGLERQQPVDGLLERAR